MIKIINLLSTRWHFARWLRLGFGLFLAFQAIALKDAFSGAIGALFLYQAVTNTGCCGIGSCAAPATFQKENLSEKETVYEEVKGTSKNSE